MENALFFNVGQLKKLLENLPDERLIVCQVVTPQKGVWNMWGRFCPQVPQGTVACMTFSHESPVSAETALMDEGSLTQAFGL